MSNLTEQPNIGKILTQKLIEAGIPSIEELRKVGTKEAFLRITAVDNSACYNTLYALDGAVQGIRWHYLPEEKKEELRQFLQKPRAGTHSSP